MSVQVSVPAPGSQQINMLQLLNNSGSIDFLEPISVFNQRLLMFHENKSLPLKQTDLDFEENIKLVVNQSDERILQMIYHGDAVLLITESGLIRSTFDGQSISHETILRHGLQFTDSYFPIRFVAAGTVALLQLSDYSIFSLYFNSKEIKRLDHKLQFSCLVPVGDDRIALTTAFSQLFIIDLGDFISLPISRAFRYLYMQLDCGVVTHLFHDEQNNILTVTGMGGRSIAIDLHSNLLLVKYHKPSIAHAGFYQPWKNEILQFIYPNLSSQTAMQVEVMSETTQVVAFPEFLPRLRLWVTSYFALMRSGELYYGHYGPFDRVDLERIAAFGYDKVSYGTEKVDFEVGQHGLLCVGGGGIFVAINDRLFRVSYLGVYANPVNRRNRMIKNFCEHLGVDVAEFEQDFERVYLKRKLRYKDDSDSENSSRPKRDDSAEVRKRGRPRKVVEVSKEENSAVQRRGRPPKKAAE